MSATKTTLVGAGDVQARNDFESLPTLLGRLSDDVLDLLNSQLALLKVEMKEQADDYALGAAMMSFAAIIAIVGFALLNVALAFGVSTLFARANFSTPVSYALGFVITGVFYLIVGLIGISVVRNHLRQRGLTPRRTVQELRKDKEWLKKEL